MIAGSLVGSAAVGGASWSVVRSNSKLATVRRDSAALGTKVSIVARHADAAVAERATDAAFAELAFLEHRLLSIYQPESEISRLNRDARLASPHPFVVYVLRRALEMSRETVGAFDVTVQPLWETFAAAKRQGRLPTEAEVAAARARVDWQAIDIDDDCVRLQKPGMAITLNGIAQGFATDRVLATLRGFDVEHALIDIGEHASLGESAAGDAWTVGIQHPRAADEHMAVADLDGRCLATSGDYATTFTSDRRHNHVVDPRTGYSPTELASVSIVAKTAMEADALSTACFVLGPDRAIDLLRRHPGSDALLVLKDGSTLVTPAFPLVEKGAAI
jgi:thiamine biosynthesis lipoprotein